MKIAILVHECHLEVGHTHAMIELVRNCDLKRIDKIEIISHTAADPEVLFPEAPEKVHFVNVPMGGLYPFLLKAFFFQVWTFFYCKFFQEKDVVRISIGTASLVADMVNVQFVHDQWRDKFFQTQKMGFLAKFYKKILFQYFVFCEDFLYRKPEMRFVILSQFVADYCIERFQLKSEQVKVIYSGVNLDKFQVSPLPREELYQKLCNDYPSLSQIDVQKPIFLFVGAYERKGLPVALDHLKEIEAQIVVVGKPSAHSEVTFPKEVKVACVSFTKELPLFYSLADAFIFPTLYEPFGLVIIEAVAMGMKVFVTRNEVGASEILGGLEGIYFLEATPTDELRGVEILSPKQREQYREKRMECLSQYNWKGAGKLFSDFLFHV